MLDILFVEKELKTITKQNFATKRQVLNETLHLIKRLKISYAEKKKQEVNKKKKKETTFF